jgi:hypothetical protein
MTKPNRSNPFRMVDRRVSIGISRESERFSS